MALDLWYTERWDEDGKAAKWTGELPDFAAVRAVILEAKGKGEIVRVRAPVNAAPADQDELDALGAERFSG
jgi:hypothetical protein